MKKSVLIVVAVLALTALLSLRLLAGGAYSNISPAEVQRRLAEGEALNIVDVREPSEFSRGHIPGSKSIPLGQISTRFTELNPDREIILVCLSGDRSVEAAKFLAEKGFKRIKNVEAGLLNWAGPIVK